MNFNPKQDFRLSLQQLATLIGDETTTLQTKSLKHDAASTKSTHFKYTIKPAFILSPRRIISFKKARHDNKLKQREK